MMPWPNMDGFVIDKQTMGFVSLGLVVFSGGPYIWSVLVRKTKPHVFTWVLWGLLTAIAALAQRANHAGPGAWATFLSAAFCLVTAVLAMSYGERQITRGDWASFVVGLGAVPLWLLTDNPLAAVVLVTLIDVLGYFPTIRKAFLRPHEEMAASYIVSNLKFVASMLAMTELSLTNVFNPVVLFVMNGILIAMIVWRKRVLLASCLHQEKRIRCWS